MSGAVYEVAVVIPAHNEQATIEACVRSVRAAASELPASVRAQIIVVLDSCSDATADRVPPDVTAVATTARCVGSARALGAARAIAQSRVRTDQLWLANTDADSVVPRNWLTETVRLAAAGADMVLGTALPEQTPTNRVMIRRWHEQHCLRPGHPYVHGANFGIRADLYLQTGGWSAMTSGEDVDLEERAARISSRIVRCSGIPVRTSSRLSGRAPDGYARFLRSLITPAEVRSP